MSDDESDEDDDVFIDLYERFPTWDDALATVRKHETFKQFRKFAEMGLSTLKPEEIDKALDDDVVPWRKFHEDIVQSVAAAKGTTKAGATRGSVVHMNTKVALKKKLCASKIEDFDTVYRKNTWRSLIQSLACLYIEELENNVDKERDELSSRIDNILATPWFPMDEFHGECIYYITGAMIKAAKDKILQRRTTDSLRESLSTLVLLQTTTKDGAIEENVPSRRVENREAVSLNYSTSAFYCVICKYESVYHTLLNEDGIRRYGEGVLKQINSLLIWKDVGMKDLLDVWASDSDVREVSIFFLNYYTNLRGKDFARKQNAQRIDSTETHRAEVGLSHKFAKEKHEKERLRESQNDDDDDDENFEKMTVSQLKEICVKYNLIKGGNKADVIKRLQSHMRKVRLAEQAQANDITENANGDDEEEGVDETDFDKMRCKQLKALCREYGLHVSGKKNDLLMRLREYHMSRKNVSEVLVGDEVEDDIKSEDLDDLLKQKTIAVHEDITLD
jgi:hypothetical protein